MEKERKELEQLLRAVELDERIRKAEIDVKPMPLEEALELAKKGKAFTRKGRVDGRAAAGKKRAKKNASRRKKNARNQRWNRKWRQRMLLKAMEGNYYPYLRGRWKQKGRGWEISEEEWLEHVQPCIPEGAVIELRRYDTSEPARLDNIVVYNMSAPEEAESRGRGRPTAPILFDGKEWKLRQLGAIL